MESEFYVTLPSNSSMQYYPNNKTSTYVTKLPKRFELNGEWEVGLAEIKYPHTWYNIKKGLNYIEVSTPRTTHFERIEITPGYYKSVNDIINALLKKRLDKISDIIIMFDDTAKRVTVTCLSGSRVRLLGDIAKVFGFMDGTLASGVGNEGFSLALPDTGNQYFYVYTDIIKGQYHGDVVVPVLRTVTVKGQPGDYISKNFERPHYVPLSKTSFDTIDINIRDEAGDLVAFEHGKVSITLHFRRSKTQYYI